MNKLAKLIKEHAAVLVIAAIVLIVLILAVIVFTIASAGNTDRKLVIADISGSVFILKNDGQISANKNMTLESGDVLITAEDGTVRLTVDKDKSVYVEPQTTMYTYYTEKAEKGSIIVNISEGAAVCRLDSSLGKNEIFQVKTPNSVISAQGTVFRTQFDYYDRYGDYTEAKLTEVQCAQGQVNIQLYDNNAAPADQLMLLAEGKSARLVTGVEAAKYLYLNSDTSVADMSEEALKTFIRIAAEREISYSLGNLNEAYQAIIGSEPAEETSISTMYPPETAPSDTAASDTDPFGTIPPLTEPSVTDTPLTLPETEETQTVTQPSQTEPSETTSSAISVTSPTSALYTVSAQTTVTTGQTTTFTETTTPTETTVPITAPPITTTTAVPTTAAPVTTTTAPVTTTAEPVTTTAPDTTTTVTEAVTETVTTVSETTAPSETIPWWEKINSAALTSEGNDMS